MTVAELIEELNKLPQDMLVMIPGYECGYDNVEVRPNTAVRLRNGRHSMSFGPTEDEITHCVVLWRGK